MMAAGGETDAGPRARVDASSRLPLDVDFLARVLPVAVPLTLVSSLMVVALATETVFWDFQLVFVPAAEDVLAGRSPYPGLGSTELGSELAYVYPPFLAYALAPLTLLDLTLATALAVFLSILAGGTAMWILGVRDPRCYGAALASGAVWDSLRVLAIGLAMTLLLALAWRHRERSAESGAALGVTVVLKLFALPLLVWPLATRRYRLCAYACAFAALTAVGPWALLGFTGLRTYPALLRELAEHEGETSFSLTGRIAAVGLGPGLAAGVALVLAACVCAVAVLVGRRGRELQCMTLALVAALIATPILWLHYLTVLLVPLSIARPRFTRIWLAPMALWVGVVAERTAWDRVLVVLVIAACTALVVRAAFTPAQTEP